MPDIPFRAKPKAMHLAVQILRALCPEDREAVWRALQEDDSLCRVPMCRYERERYRPYCSAHRARLKRYGDVLADVPIRRKTQPVRQVAVHTLSTAVDGRTAGHAA